MFAYAFNMIFKFNFMRKLKIATRAVEYHLENVPSEYSFVEALSQQHANYLQDLKTFYSVGVLAAEKLKANHSAEYFEKKVVWLVRQTIIEKKNKK